MMWYVEYNTGTNWKKIMCSQDRELIKYVASAGGPRYRMRGERI